VPTTDELIQNFIPIIFKMVLDSNRFTTIN